MKREEFVKRIEEIVDAPIDITAVLALVDLYDTLIPPKGVRSKKHLWTDEELEELICLRGTMQTKDIAVALDIPIRIVTNKLYQIDKERR